MLERDQGPALVRDSRVFFETAILVIVGFSRAGVPAPPRLNVIAGVRVIVLPSGHEVTYVPGSVWGTF